MAAFLLPAIAMGVQAGVGIAQYLSGRSKAKNLRRPAYEIPEGIGQNVSLAQQMAQEGLPEAQRQAYLQQLNRSTATGMGQLRSRGQAIGGVGAVVDAQNQSLLNLLAMDAQTRRQNQQILMQQRGVMAGYEDKAFQLNQLNPYMEAAAEARALQGAGMQNVMGGLTNMASSYLTFQGNKQLAEAMGGGGAKTSGGGSTRGGNFNMPFLASNIWRNRRAQNAGNVAGVQDNSLFLGAAATGLGGNPNYGAW